MANKETLPQIVEAVGHAAGTSSASGAGQTVAGAPNVAGGGAAGVPVENAPTPQRRKQKRTSLDRIPGRRPMKEYPLTEDDLDTIGLLQGSATIAFGAAGTCFGLFLSVRMAIDFAGSGISQRTMGWWAGLAFGALAAAILLAAAGFFLRYKGRTRINRIKQDTIHDE